ncbi:hypothetical protein NKY66_11110 [Sinorhizobium meliloti]
MAADQFEHLASVQVFKFGGKAALKLDADVRIGDVVGVDLHHAVGRR